MLSPAQVVFDFFSHAPPATQFTRHEIKIRLSAFPKSHIDGAIAQLINCRKLIRVKNKYAFAQGAQRPIAAPHSIDYQDATSRGYLFAPFSQPAKVKK